MSTEGAGQLLLRNRDRLDGRVLLVNPGPDELARRLLQEHAVDSVAVFSQHFADHRVHQRLADDGLEAWFGAQPPAQARFSTAVVFLAREKARTRLLVHLAASCLDPGGRLMLVGHNRAGIKSSGRFLSDHAEGVEKIDAARHCVLFGGVVTRTAEPFRLSDHRQAWTATVAGVELTLVSYPGVFGHGRVDAGSRLLLEHLEPRASMVDMGSGCGLIGAWAGLRSPGLDLVAGDSDALALAATAETLAANAVQARVVPCDGWEGIDSPVTQLVSNPPFHRGVATDYRVTEELIRRAPERLAPDGEMVLVANAFLDYPQRIEAALGRCEVLARDGRFTVMRGRRGRSLR